MRYRCCKDLEFLKQFCKRAFLKSPYVHSASVLSFFQPFKLNTSFSLWLSRHPKRPRLRQHSVFQRPGAPPSSMCRLGEARVWQTQTEVRAGDSEEPGDPEGTGLGAFRHQEHRQLREHVQTPLPGIRGGEIYQRSLHL